MLYELLLQNSKTILLPWWYFSALLDEVERLFFLSPDDSIYSPRYFQKQSSSLSIQPAVSIDLSVVVALHVNNSNLNECL